MVRLPIFHSSSNNLLKEKFISIVIQGRSKILTDLCFQMETIFL